MRNLFLVSLIFISGISNAQLIQGNISVKGQSKVELSPRSGKAVNLYADFRENSYPIHFSFTGTDIPLNDEKKEVVQFVFSTTVRKDGKVVGSFKRNPIPFFPGDMFMPVETFDFISVLSNLQTNDHENVSEMPSGNYEVILEAKAVGIKGDIKPVRLLIKI